MQGPHQPHQPPRPFPLRVPPSPLGLVPTHGPLRALSPEELRWYLDKFNPSARIAALSELRDKGCPRVQEPEWLEGLLPTCAKSQQGVQSTGVRQQRHGLWVRNHLVLVTDPFILNVFFQGMAMYPPRSPTQGQC